MTIEWPMKKKRLTRLRTKKIEAAELTATKRWAKPTWRTEKSC